ncbi:MAG: acyltransferase [Rhodothermales bacterium]|nr:acyltransferase [Rhodothermales bacterium]NNE56444.1 acyltransferase [Flavobacteriales bacterium]
MQKRYSTHGDGSFESSDFRSIGKNVIFEHGVLVFHPNNILLGENIYVGHNTILKAYHENHMVIGDNTWIGQGCFFHSAGGIKIGMNVGIGPSVKIITSYHEEAGVETPILFSPLTFEGVVVGDDSDIGVGASILPGVRIGKGVQVGAGSVVTKDLPDFSVAAGVPAKVLRTR